MNRLAAAAFRLPAPILRSWAGRLCGHRFLLLEHTGRRTGRRLMTPLEVLRWDRRNLVAVVLVGFGPRTGWYRNLRANPDCSVWIAGRCHRASAGFLDAGQAAAELEGYLRQHRFAGPVARLLIHRGVVAGGDDLRAVALRLDP